MNNHQSDFILYHYQIHFPKHLGDMVLDFFNNFEVVKSSIHCKNQLMDDRNMVMKVPTKDDLMNPRNTLVEVQEFVDSTGVGTKRMRRGLIRCHHMNPYWDCCYIVGADGYIITGWSNAKDDIHRLKSKHVYYSNTYDEVMEVPEVLKP